MHEGERETRGERGRATHTEKSRKHIRVVFPLLCCGCCRATASHPVYMWVCLWIWCMRTEQQQKQQKKTQHTIHKVIRNFIYIKYSCKLYTFANANTTSVRLPWQVSRWAWVSYCCLRSILYTKAYTQTCKQPYISLAHASISDWSKRKRRENQKTQFRNSLE